MLALYPADWHTTRCLAGDSMPPVARCSRAPGKDGDLIRPLGGTSTHYAASRLHLKLLRHTCFKDAVNSVLKNTFERTILWVPALLA